MKTTDIGIAMDVSQTLSWTVIQAYFSEKGLVRCQLAVVFTTLTHFLAR